MKKELNPKEVIQQFIKAANAFDVEAIITLFANDAVIADISVGEKFKGVKEVRQYIDQFFVGYHTVTKLESINILEDGRYKTQVDFKGDFGHETGVLILAINSNGLISAIDAYLD